MQPEYFFPGVLGYVRSRRHFDTVCVLLLPEDALPFRNTLAEQATGESSKDQNDFYNGVSSLLLLEARARRETDDSVLYPTRRPRTTTASREVLESEFGLKCSTVFNVGEPRGRPYASSELASPANRSPSICAEK